MRTVLAVVLLLGAASACAPVREPTPPPPENGVGTTQDTIPSSLLRRLAEAADGFRDGQPRFVVADRNFQMESHGHRVVGVFLNRGAAVAARDSAAKRDSGTDYDVFGPYRTVESPPQVINPAEEIIEVTVRTKKGSKTYSGRMYDALFWSLPAFDKFVVPYLSRVGGPAYAARQRELYRLGKSPLAGSQAVPHWRSSF